MYQDTRRLDLRNSADYSKMRMTRYVPLTLYDIGLDRVSFETQVLKDTQCTNGIQRATQVDTASRPSCKGHLLYLIKISSTCPGNGHAAVNTQHGSRVQEICLMDWYWAVRR